ncbi:MAG: hypothetical protein M1838_004654 [Thelocarpon superellum]|nr:MAG: hypothetical protein M1838_004654 [Thelocarpon superellum]
MVTAEERAAKRAKPWKGGKKGGPEPARHIPWPEIFKHHMSVVEGHERMLEMVQKHTVPNSNNWITITTMVERSKEMISQHKSVMRSFVPRTDTFSTVPLGSSSASMYPGYSPADHEYGEASMEAGAAISEAKKRGIDVLKDPSLPTYQIGQAHGAKRQMMFQHRDKPANGPSNGTSQPEGESRNAKAPQEAAPADGDNPYFVIDTHPTPVDATSASQPTKKRGSADQSTPEARGGKKVKKAKTEAAAAIQPQVEFEDISAEVDARLKAKEEKRRRKEEKKRKRESGDSAMDVDVETKDENRAEVEVEKPTKKKLKKKPKREKEGTVNEGH